MRHFKVYMSEILKNPIKPTKKSNGSYPFEFKAPSYDNRTSCSMAAGNDYGKGFNNPIGKDEPRGYAEGPLGAKTYAFSPDRVMYGEDIEG